MPEKAQNKPIDTKTKVSGKVNLEKRAKDLKVRNDHNFKFSKEDKGFSYFWAIQQILVNKCTEFEYPKEYVLNNRYNSISNFILIDLQYQFFLIKSLFISSLSVCIN
jgi:hypothetical protein